jgi:hypothetical protein
MAGVQQLSIDPLLTYLHKGSPPMRGHDDFHPADAKVKATFAKYARAIG